MQDINEKFYQAALTKGVTREQFKFAEFRIKDFDSDYLQEKEEQMEQLKREIEEAKENAPEVDATGNVINIKDAAHKRTTRFKKFDT